MGTIDQIHKSNPVGDALLGVLHTTSSTQNNPRSIWNSLSAILKKDGFVVREDYPTLFRSKSGLFIVRSVLEESHIAVYSFPNSQIVFEMYTCRKPYDCTNVFNEFALLNNLDIIQYDQFPVAVGKCGPNFKQYRVSRWSNASGYQAAARGMLIGIPDDDVNLFSVLIMKTGRDDESDEYDPSKESAAENPLLDNRLIEQSFLDLVSEFKGAGGMFHQNYFAGPIFYQSCDYPGWGYTGLMHLTSDAILSMHTYPEHHRFALSANYAEGSITPEKIAGHFERLIGARHVHVITVPYILKNGARAKPQPVLEEVLECR